MGKHVVIIGAVALGPKAAARFKRLEPGSRVTMIDRCDTISYGGCGIPYYVSGDVSDASQLCSTSFHMVRDAEFFRLTKGVDVLTGVEALGIDRRARQVRVKALGSGAESMLDYDNLVLAMGASPRRLGLPGEDLSGVWRISNLGDATSIRQAVAAGKVAKAVVVGAGFIGLEMAEALSDMWDVDTTVVEVAPQIMPRNLSPVLARMAMRRMEEKGVRFHLGETVKEILGEGGAVRGLRTDRRTLDAQLVVIAAGVVPNADLAVKAGLDVSRRGGVLVNARLQTSDPRIFAGGDLIEMRHLITGEGLHLPMGSMANRQGRVIGDNLAGGNSRFDGAVGAFAVKLFDLSASGVGLTLDAARAWGADAVSVLIVQADRAHFYPTKEAMTLELVVEKGTRRILGMQGVAASGDALVGKVNTLAAMLRFRPLVEDLGNLETAYSPPFSSALDILNALGNLADNVLAGRNVPVSPDRFETIWNTTNGDGPLFVDCREASDAGPLARSLGGRWINIPQGQLRERAGELPAGRPVVLVCNTGARSYEAQINLRSLGRCDVSGVQGGLAAVSSYCSWPGSPAGADSGSNPAG